MTTPLSPMLLATLITLSPMPPVFCNTGVNSGYDNPVDNWAPLYSDNIPSIDPSRVPGAPEPAAWLGLGGLIVTSRLIKHLIKEGKK